MNTPTIDSAARAEHPKYDRDAFERVATLLDEGADLTFEMVGDVYGKEFWMALVMTLMDAGDAARAIQGAVARLSGKKVRK